MMKKKYSYYNYAEEVKVSRPLKVIVIRFGVENLEAARTDGPGSVSIPARHGTAISANSA